MEDKSKSTKDNIMKLLSDWGLFIVSIIIIVTYTVMSTIQTKSEELNIWTNIFFVVLNLLAAFYISRQVSMWGWLTENSTNQKKIAKTAIRHNRGNLTSIVKLIKITKEKIESVDDTLIKQYLKEIKNHLEMIYNGIKNSEADFHEIVNEELKEQNNLEFEISELLEEIERNNFEVKEMENVLQSHKETIKTDKETIKTDKETIKKLKETIREKENVVSLKVSNLPFGSGSFLSGSSFNLPDYTNRLFIGGDQNNINLSDYFSGKKI